MTSDDEWLHIEHFDPLTSPPPLVVVFVHGFSPYAAPYRHVGGALVEAGFAATFYDARGHGHSTGRRGYVRDFSDYTDDLAQVVALARAPYGDPPFALLGFSQGGAVVLDHLLRGEATPQPIGVVLAAPMLEIILPLGWWARVFAKIGAIVAPKLRVPNGIRPELITSNEEVLRAFWRDPLVHHVATPHWRDVVLRTLPRLRESATKLALPTLLLTAGRDRIVSPDAQHAFARSAPAGILEQRIYPNMNHEVFLDPGRDNVVNDVIKWLQGLPRS